MVLENGTRQPLCPYRQKGQGTHGKLITPMNSAYETFIGQIFLCWLLTIQRLLSNFTYRHERPGGFIHLFQSGRMRCLNCGNT